MAFTSSRRSYRILHVSKFQFIDIYKYRVNIEYCLGIFSSRIAKQLSHCGIPKVRPRRSRPAIPVHVEWEYGGVYRAGAISLFDDFPALRDICREFPRTTAKSPSLLLSGPGFSAGSIVDGSCHAECSPPSNSVQRRRSATCRSRTEPGPLYAFPPDSD